MKINSEWSFFPSLREFGKRHIKSKEFSAEIKVIRSPHERKPSQAKQKRWVPSSFIVMDYYDPWPREEGSRDIVGGVCSKFAHIYWFTLTRMQSLKTAPFWKSHESEISKACFDGCVSSSWDVTFWSNGIKRIGFSNVAGTLFLLKAKPRPVSQKFKAILWSKSAYLSFTFVNISQSN